MKSKNETEETEEEEEEEAELDPDLAKSTFGLSEIIKN